MKDQNSTLKSGDCRVPFLNVMAMFQSALDKTKIIKEIRASTLASYYWCSPKAWLVASGMQVPRSKVLSAGTLIHDNILNARKRSPQEIEFKSKLDEFFTETISRPWIDNNTMIVGDIKTHGFDDWKVDSNRQVTLLEYKTKKGWGVTPVSLLPAIFQSKLYCWIMSPYLQLLGYSWKEIWVIFLKRERSGDFVPIGEAQVHDYDPIEIERQLAKIFDEWDRASKAKTNAEKRGILIPPKAWKCRICAKNSAMIFKVCPFQCD